MKNLLHRFFLIVEGKQDGYPNYESAKVHFSIDDPCNYDFENLFICSPLFSLNKEGAELPNLQDGTTITFVMMPNVCPNFKDIYNQYGENLSLWFSLGLANLVIIENDGNKTSKLIKSLEKANKITSFETWEIKNLGINSYHPKSRSKKQKSIKHFKNTLSEQLPPYLKFSVSEYIISIDKFLTASKKYTPHYYEAHNKTIKITISRLIDDISFLYGDSSKTPSNLLLKSLNTTNKEKALVALKEPKLKDKIEEIINDRHGRLIQFNSAISYVYSQAYAGTFPIFDHIGIIRRHSLLGIGSAISALFELISQMEESFSHIPYEDFDNTPYNNLIHNDYLGKYVDVLQDPTNYESSCWISDPVKDTLLSTKKPNTQNINKHTNEAGYYNRVAFFSGRLGFREYDFSATSAIQVLIASHSLNWNVINYTHEIIHNHVRTILTKNLINIPQSARQEDFTSNGREMLSIIEKIITHKQVPTLTYRQYFTLLLVKYCINAKYYGSLSMESDQSLSEKEKLEQKIPDSSQLKNLINFFFKDINEIFVHTIDFSYIYKKDIEVYVLSIWSSWSTITSVTHDLKQYIVRTLIIIGLTTKGKSYNRYNESKNIFLSLLSKLSQKNNDAPIFRHITTIFETETDDLQRRFCNSIILTDLVYHFFVANLSDYLDKEDENVLNITQDNKKVIYSSETNEFSHSKIKSKVRFLLNQLIREIENTEERSDMLYERTSSWLLLSLSSYNYE